MVDRDGSLEREVLATGIGGQGVQLATRTLAEAAVADGRRVQLFASYGGMMRGGNSDATLVIGERAVTAPPVVGSAWAALVLHQQHAAAVWARLAGDGPVVVNSSVVDVGEVPAHLHGRLLEVPALDEATALGAPVAAALVLVGVLAGSTGLVSAEALLGTPERVLPPYRSDAAAVNRAALEVGLALAPASIRPAWSGAGAEARA